MTQQITIRVSDDEYNSIKATAKNYGISLSELIKETYFLSCNNPYDDRIEYAKYLINRAKKD